MEPTTPRAFKPYISPEISSVAEFSIKAIILGIIFGILFGAATVYLALKAGLFQLPYPLLFWLFP
jgi:uncharacterized oligopeptide transporter (OPT) family protein